MKKVLSVLFIVSVMVGCHQDHNAVPRKGGLVFSLTSNDISGKGNSGGRVDSQNDPAAVILSIKDSQGNLVASGKKIQLYNFGKSYTTESIDLAVGDYTVTQFWVLNAANSILYVSPLEGSYNANLVIDPLPIGFHISENGSTAVTVEVVTLSGTDDPEAYGYASFNFHVAQENINLTFVASTNPFMTTNGYNSVKVTFTSGQTVIEKELTVISPVEARGSISALELGLPNTGQPVSWTAKVSALYESIDEVPYNLHINEALTTVALSVAPDTKLIKFEGSKVNLTKADQVYASKDLAWENWSHLTDETGYFHFLVKNDICYPVFKYDIKKEDVYYVQYDKNVSGKNPDGSSFSFLKYGYNYKSDYDYIDKGTYTVTDTFANMCPPQYSGNLGGYYLFRVWADAGYHDCYIVWMYKDTPIDPNAPDGNKVQVPNFQIMSAAGFSKMKDPKGGRIATN
ncbi:hypothetical protein WSM22_21430 [Cytophagales bacterium WSM2-2]|nr:hypothetical protein WSM22_21430 [Cytophagales bacterium WSM2-2]